MIPHIFREYDIRGVFPDELNQETVDRLGRALGTYFHDKGARRISLGRDCRLSSPRLAQWLLNGLLASGMTIVDVGMVPTPILYFSLHHLRVDGGIQITGSHNPPEFNGFKICLGHASVYGKEIQAIGKTALSGKFTTGNGTLEKTAVDEPYVDWMVSNIHPGPITLKAVVDGGNGVAGPPALEIYRRLGFDTHPLFCEPDGKFPNHHPDPTLSENLQSLIETVHQIGADLGIAFDGDGDRIGVVDPKGRIIPADHLIMIFARDLLTRHKGAKVIGDVKCSQALFDDIRAHGGNPVMWKSGQLPHQKQNARRGCPSGGRIERTYFFWGNVISDTTTQLTPAQDSWKSFQERRMDSKRCFRAYRTWSIRPRSASLVPNQRNSKSYRTSPTNSEKTLGSSTSSTWMVPGFSWRAVGD